MKILTAQQVMDQYIKSCEIMKEATLNGNYKANNKEGKKLRKVYGILEERIELAKESLPFLFNHQNVVTRSQAASHCIGLNIFINQAEDVLNKIARDESNGIFAFNAEMILRVWKEQGYLKF